MCGESPSPQPSKSEIRSSRPRKRGEGEDQHCAPEIPVKIVDLSRELYHKTPTYPGHPPIIHGVWTTHEESFVASGNVHGLSSMYISMPDHAGPHIHAF